MTAVDVVCITFTSMVLLGSYLIGGVEGLGWALMACGLSGLIFMPIYCDERERR